MIDTRALAALRAILATGSFDRAAAQLGVTPSAVSQRLRTLEDRLGGALVIRAQPCTATPLGARIARHAEAVALMEQRLLSDLTDQAGPRPRLRIAVSADSLATWVLPALRKVDDTLFDLVLDDQDHAHEQLRQGQVAGAITTRATPLQGCDAHPLGVMRYHAMAAPDFLARWFAHGVSAEALRKAPALVFNAKDSLQHRWATATTGQDIALPAHIIGAAQGFRDAAVMGLGWGMLPAPLAQPAQEAGQLLRLPGDPLDIALTWQVSRALGTAVAPLTRALRQTAQHLLRPPVQPLPSGSVR